jgi:hypothetical protein
MKKFKNWLENCGFFDEDHQFFNGFEITKTGNSLILFFFAKIKIDNSLILEYLRIKTNGSLKIQRNIQHKNIPTSYQINH